AHAACGERYGRMSVAARGAVGNDGRTRRLARELLQVVALEPSARRQYDELASGAVLEADFGEEVARGVAVGTELRQHLDPKCAARRVEARRTLDVEALGEVLAICAWEPCTLGRIKQPPP